MKRAFANQGPLWRSGRERRSMGLIQDRLDGSGLPSSAEPQSETPGSPFFWWIKALMLTCIAVALFPAVLALLVLTGLFAL